MVFPHSKVSINTRTQEVCIRYKHLTVKVNYLGVDNTQVFLKSSYMTQTSLLVPIHFSINLSRCLGIKVTWWCEVVPRIQIITKRIKTANLFVRTVQLPLAICLMEQLFTTIKSLPELKITTSPTITFKDPNFTNNNRHNILDINRLVLALVVL